MKKITLVFNIPSPYRVEFLNQLSKELDIFVIFEDRTTKDREQKWFEDSNINFSHMYISDKRLNLFRALKIMIKSNKLLIGGYSTKFCSGSIILLKLFKKRFILNADGGFIKKENRILFLLKKYLISSATWWLSTGEETSKYFVHYGAKKSNIYNYHFSSIMSDEIEYIADRKKYKNSLGIPTDKNMILFTGKFIERKGVSKLIQASNLLPEYNFYLIGGKPNDFYLDLLSNNKNITFIDHLSKKELMDYYSAADLFVFPTNYDIWGLVINEAFSKGLPTISTNKCIAALEMIGENAKLGHIVDASIDYKELANSIKKAVINIDSFDEKLIVKTAQKYSIEEMVKEHVEILNNII
ncbi:glycosyltransferase family 4 protein [Macrococcus caseolyticus]|uniref:glycosyltransferase family 4 protein n=1 Tax=Macrococcoides caseolyticum TaxID=69966 RepID=UPI0024BD0069|nr:glycosyltransferase family 4 protein [Macrococcus caseolyticus]MDJ1109157.1 glycosyltransferase family 4 protein [Macrococcus caseolyticus]